MKFFKDLCLCASALLVFSFASCSKSSMNLLSANKENINKVLDGAKQVFSDESIRKTWELKSKETQIYLGEELYLEDVEEYKTITANKNSEYLKFTNDFYYTQVGYNEGEKLFNVGGYAYVWLTGNLNVTIGTQIYNYKVKNISDTQMITYLEYPYEEIDEKTGNKLVYLVKETKTYKTGVESVVSSLVDLFNKK